MPLSSLMDATVLFIVEGVKAMYRMTYAVVKMNKEFIKSIKSKDDFISHLSQYSKKMMPTTHEKFMNAAFSYPLGKAKKYKFSQQQVTSQISKSFSKDKMAEMIDYLPNAPLKSSIIDYQLYATFWMMVPPYIRIRFP